MFLAEPIVSPSILTLSGIRDLHSSYSLMVLWNLGGVGRIAFGRAGLAVVVTAFGAGVVVCGASIGVFDEVG